MDLGTSTVTSKGQVTIPKAIRDAMGFDPGTSVVFIEVDGLVVLKRADTLEDLFEIVQAGARELGLTREEIDEAVREARRETMERHYGAGPS